MKNISRLFVVFKCFMKKRSRNDSVEGSASFPISTARSFMLRVAVMTLSLAALFFFPGCGSNKPRDLPRLYETTLVLTQENEPLKNAMVLLFSDDPSYRWIVSGTSDEKGEVDLYTHSLYRGAPTGTFKVCVTKTETDGDPELISAENQKGPTPETVGKGAPPGRIVTVKRYDYVEPIYSDMSQTPLTIEVAPGKNRIPLNVGKIVKIEKKIKL